MTAIQRFRVVFWRDVRPGERTSLDELEVTLVNAVRELDRRTAHLEHLGQMFTEEPSATQPHPPAGETI